jgi:hypothetical protein
LFVLSPFAYDQSVRGLNSEPLHLFLVIWAIAFFLRFLAIRHWSYLILLAFTLGLDYLDRVNGLFLAFSAFAVLISFELSQYLLGSEHRGAAAARANSGRQTPNAKRLAPNVAWWHYLLAASF